MNGNVPNARARHENEDADRYREANGGPLNAFQSRDDILALDKMTIEMIENRMQVMLQTLADDIDVQLNSMKTEVMQRLHENKPGKNAYRKETSEHKQKNREGTLADKQFASRNSYLTDLFKINHFRTIYNIFAVMLVILFSNTAVHDYIETGTTHLGLQTIKLGFGSVHEIVQIWSIMTASTCVTYLGFLLWSNKHIELAPKSIPMKILDYSSLIAFIAHQIVFILVPAKLTIERMLPPAAGLLILMEQVRMMMKTYAFVRSNVPRVLAYKCKDEDNQRSCCPEFTKFLYFMFAPTLIYRDEYLRTKSIRWKVVLWNLTEVFLIIFYTAFILERFIIPPFKNYGPRIFEPQFVILTIFSSMLPGIVMYLFGFYCILHSWQNAMAELLRFADRLFYKDWWNCTSFGEFFRTWNILVHDWLYQYIYKDVYIKSHNKVHATLITFIVSAVFHEYILTVAFGFFYPVMFFSFAGFSVFLVFFMKKYKKLNGNIYVWLAIITGQGVLYTLYPMEFYARSNCPPYSDQLLDLLLPRSWICHNVLNVTTSLS